MYTDRELNAAAGIIRQIAREHQTPEERVRLALKKSMNAGRNNPDPVVQARWATFRFSGLEPTVEEFILWAAALTRRMTG